MCAFLAGVLLARTVVAAVLLTLLGGAAPAAAAPLEPPRTLATPAEDARAIRIGLRRAVAAGRLTAADARGYGLVVRRSQAVLTLLPGTRGETLARVLRLVRLQARAFNRPRALALFSMLATNADYLAVRGLPADKTDVTGDDGVVYRAGWGYGLQFHPLGNFAALNAHVLGKREEEAARLAAALAARAVPAPGGAVWEYYFPFGYGRPPWISGMAQSVAAQAFARAGTLLGEARFLSAARLAYGAIAGRRLLLSLSSGPWIRHYSFSDLVVLNSQLQSLLSLWNYAGLTNDARAAALASRLEASAKRLFPRFDTGYWSHYSLGRESSLHYHLYVVTLLERLAERTGDEFWRGAVARFERYLHEPPIFRAGAPVPLVYPWPADGFRDSARVSFWLSKVSTVTVTVGGERRFLGVRSDGWHTVVWRPGRRAPGAYRPVVAAVDLAGNRGTATLQPVVLAIDREPPAVTARVAGRRLAWRAHDTGTPWVRLAVHLERRSVRKVLSLGVRPLAGSALLRLPRGRWNAVLAVSDSSGNRTRVPLGALPATPPG